MSSDYRLAYGTHATPEEGRCAMEWVSYLAGEPHGDEPACVSPVVRAFCVALNDGLDDEQRQRLRPYLARTIGTSTDGWDTARAWMAMDWLIRTYVPTWLEGAGLSVPARVLAGLAPVGDADRLRDALGPLRSAATQAREAWSMALSGAGPVDRASALISRGAARESAWESGAAAVWAAARLGVGDSAGDRARAAARDAGGDAAAAIGRRVGAGAGRAKARAMAEAAIAPVIAELRRSVLELLHRMLPMTPVPAELAVPAVAAPLPAPADPARVPAAGVPA